MKTFKEDAEEYYNNNIFCDGITEFEHDIAIRCYIAGAKDQQEKMYSAEKPKQELPYWFETQGWEDFNKLVENNFGAKPKQEKMYSEEDMAESFMACWKANVPEGFECKLSFKEWFEQFKKKQSGE